MTHTSFKLVAPLAAFLVACVPLPDEASLDVEVVVRDVGTSVTRLAVEFESGEDLRRVDPEVTRPETRVFFAEAPSGEFEVVVRGFDVSGAEVVTRTGTGSVGSSVAVVQVSLAPLPLVGCDDPEVTHDDDGFACWKPLANLPVADAFRPGQVVALEGSVLVAETASGHQPRRVWLVRADGRVVPVLADATPEDIVVSPGGRAALVPSARDEAGKSAVALVVVGESPAVTLLEAGRASPGGYGFAGDALAWLVTGADDSRLVLVPTSGADVPDQQQACAAGRVRGPLAVADDGSFAAFEQMEPEDGDAFAFVLRAGGACELSPEAPGAVPGGWAVSSDARAFAWRVLFDGGTELHAAIPADGYQAKWQVKGNIKGTLGVDGLGRGYALTSEGLMRFEVEGEDPTRLSTGFGALASFDSRLIDDGAAVVARSLEGDVGYIAADALSLQRVIGAVQWAGRRWLPDGSIVLWQQATAGSGAWWLPPEAGQPFVFTDALEQHHLEVLSQGGEPVPLAGRAGELIDLRQSSAVLDARTSGAFDGGLAGLVYVDPANKNLLLRATLDAAPVKLSPEPALAAGVAVESNRYWVVFDNGDVATIGIPRSVQ